MIERTIEEVKERRNRVAEMMPDFVENDKILMPQRQRELSKLNEIQFLDYLMDRNTSEVLGIYPEFASPIMREFSEEIFERLDNLENITSEDLPKLRRKLNNNGKMITLSNFGELYTQIPRDEGATMPSGKLEYKVSKATHIYGTNFIATTIKGYYGFVRMFEEEIAKIAPKHSNAYLLGTGWNVVVKDTKVESPIIATHYGRVNLKDEMYQVLPIKFFNIEVDKSQKYQTETEKGRDKKGDYIKIFAAPIKE